MNRIEIFEALKKNNDSATIGSMNEIAITIEKLTFIIIVDENDEEYFRILLPNFWKKPKNIGQQKALTAAIDVARDVKLAKVFFIKDEAWGAIEGYCKSSNQFLEDFGKYTKILSGVRMVFSKKILEK